MQNYYTFHLVLTLKSNNNKTLHVVILSTLFSLVEGRNKGRKEGLYSSSI